MDADASIEEEVDQMRSRTDQNCCRQRGHHRTTARRRLVHVLGVAANGPECGPEEQRDQRPDQRPRGNAVRDALECLATGQRRDGGRDVYIAKQHGGLAFA